MQPLADSANRSQSRRSGRGSALFPAMLRRAWTVLENTPHHLSWIAVIAFLGLALTTGLLGSSQGYGMAHRIMALAGFRIDAVRISGISELTETDVISALELPEVASLILFDVEDARVALESISWVKSVSVRKIYPNGLDISISERRPFARWQHEGKLTLVDPEGTVLAETGISRYSSYPLLAGEEANVRGHTFLEMLSAFETVSRDTIAAVHIARRRWDIILDDGTRVMLPERRAVFSLNWLERVRAGGELPALPLASIDLRIPGRIALTPRDGAPGGAGAVRDAALKLKELVE